MKDWPSLPAPWCLSHGLIYDSTSSKNVGLRSNPVNSGSSSTLKCSSSSPSGDSLARPVRCPEDAPPLRCPMPAARPNGVLLVRPTGGVACSQPPCRPAPIGPTDPGAALPRVDRLDTSIDEAEPTAKLFVPPPLPPFFPRTGVTLLEPCRSSR